MYKICELGRNIEKLKYWIISRFWVELKCSNLLILIFATKMSRPENEYQIQIYVVDVHVFALLT